MVKTSAPLGTAPFALFDDQRPGGRGLLFAAPREIVETRDPGAVRAALRRLAGRHAAGFLCYEAGPALEPKLAPLRRRPAEGEPPLLWFGLFDPPREIDPESLLADPAAAWAGPARPRIGASDYRAAAARVMAHIEAGDIYQANLTFRAEVRFAGHPLALYAAIRDRARAGHGALLFTGAHWILSFSPELFFETDGRRIVTRPMKGTAPRGADPETLRADPKQRAENLMIVDLLRNDLSRVSNPGSVQVDALFEIETYPTVLQMTSTISATLADGIGPVGVIEALFPCGSITGAPKIRAMELIDEIEQTPRGVYTGAIGWAGPGGTAQFNVAIRTLTVKAGEERAEIGLGSGVVADSRAGEEWRECLAKGAFVSGPDRSFDLIETMRFDPEAGMPDLDRHLARLARSAAALDFAFDRHEARNELQAATFRLPGAARVRLRLSPTGAIAIEIAPLPAPPAEPATVALRPRSVRADDFRLAHKTSDRGFYDAERDPQAFETVFTDDAGFVTEGSFTTVFVPKGGRLVTPPLARGVLPGVLRERLIEQGEASEGDLTAADLGGGFFVGNALRGLIRARPA